MNEFIPLVAVAVFFIGGCVSMESTGETTVTNDPYKDEATVTTTEYEMSSGSDPLLRAYIPKNKVEDVDTSGVFSTVEYEQPSYQVYFQMVSDEWHYWDTVRYKLNGNVEQTSLDRASSDVNCTGGCTHYEDVAASISRSDLEAIAENGGISFRVYSGEYNDVSQDVDISGQEVKDFLKSVDRVKEEIKEAR